MIQTIHFRKYGNKGLDVSRQASGHFTIRTWHDRKGVVTSAPALILTEDQMMELFDNIGRALILTVEDELAQIMEAM